MTFESWTVAAAIEAELIQFEASTGANIPTARRPLTDREIAAGTQFGDLDAIVTTNTAEGVPLIDELYAAAEAAILAEIYRTQDGAWEDTAEVAVVVGLLMLLMSERPTLYLESIQRTQPELHRLLSQSYDGGVLTVVDEARRQGQDTSTWNRPGVSPIPGVLAASIAGHPLTRTLERLIKELQSTRRAVAGTISRTDMQTVLAGTTRKGSIDLLKQGNQAAMAQGRIDTVERLGITPGLIVASEILDDNTCVPCKTVDGQEYPSLEAAAVDYPSGYAGCSGGARCRGVLVFLWAL